MEKSISESIEAVKKLVKELEKSSDTGQQRSMFPNPFKPGDPPRGPGEKKLPYAPPATSASAKEEQE